jgi:hypothetical protein
MPRKRRKTTVIGLGTLTRKQRHQQMREKAKERPSNYNSLPANEQWSIDKRLGILDYDPNEC